MDSRWWQGRCMAVLKLQLVIFWRIVGVTFGLFRKPEMALQMLEGIMRWQLLVHFPVFVTICGTHFFWTNQWSCFVGPFLPRSSNIAKKILTKFASELNLSTMLFSFLFIFSAQLFVVLKKFLFIHFIAIIHFSWMQCQLLPKYCTTATGDDSFRAWWKALNIHTRIYNFSFVCEVYDVTIWKVQCYVPCGAPW